MSILESDRQTDVEREREMNLADTGPKKGTLFLQYPKMR